VTDNYLTAQDLYSIVSLSEPQFKPDGRWLAYERTEMDEESNSYSSAIWLAPLGGGPPRQFTSGQKRDRFPRWSPTHPASGRSWLAFVSNRGGEDAKEQIYLMPTDGGEARQLTHMENGAKEPAWSPVPAGADRWRIAFTSRLNAREMAAEDAGQALDPEEKKEKEEEQADPRVIDRFAYRAETSFFDGRTAHLYVLDIDPETGRAMGKPRRLTGDERNYSDPHWLPDGSALVAMVSRQPGKDDLFYHSDIVRVPLDGSPIEILTGPDTADRQPRPSPDGRWITYLSVPADEYTTANTEIKRVPAGGGQPEVLTSHLDAHADAPSWTPDSQYICFRVPQRGRIDLHRVPAAGGTVEPLLTAEREILAYDLAPDGQMVGFVASTDRAPWDLYAADVDLSAAPGALTATERRLVAANDDWLAAKTLGQVEDLWFESADGTPIHGWVVLPPDRQPGRRYPLVLSIHGGPHAMWSRHEPTMWHEWQVLAARGYVVLACNPRGSDGYGRDFRATLQKRWGEADLPDLMAGVDQAIARGYADPGRLVLTGGSYGGFMTAWVIGHDDRFKAAVAQRGVYDLSGFYSTTDIPLLTEWEFGAAPWQDPDLLWEYSPLAHVAQIHTPLLLIHAENDFRAPIPTAEGLFVALRHLEREVQMVRYPRDGHELSRSGEPKHRVDRLERIADWFDRYVQGKEVT
jgi:dipeptidyl aminopeptidase/acylaminoacyl peptidase